MFHCLLPHKVEPSFEADPEEHLLQEGVHHLALGLVFRESFTGLVNFLQLAFRSLSDLVEFKLGHELDELHFSVQPELAVFLSHQAIEELVEVDKPVVGLDSHLEQILHQLCIVLLWVLVGLWNS